MDESPWLVEQYEKRHGRKPHLCDIIEAGDRCVQLGRHEFDPAADRCVRCGKLRKDYEA